MCPICSISGYLPSGCVGQVLNSTNGPICKMRMFANLILVAALVSSLPLIANAAENRITHFPNGQIAEQYSLREYDGNNIQHGMYTHWYPDCTKSEIKGIDLNANTPVVPAPQSKGKHVALEENQYDCLLRNISHCFRRNHVLHDVSLSIHKGEFFSILGTSGLDKTTTMLIIGGGYHS